MRTWRTGGFEVGDLIRLDNGEFEDRLGHCWARGRLKEGDLLVVTEHSGDFFFDHMLLEHSRMTLEGAPMLRVQPITAPIGAYALGRHVGSVSREDLTRLLAGETLSIAMPKAYETPAEYINKVEGSVEEA